MFYFYISYYMSTYNWGVRSQQKKSTLSFAHSLTNYNKLLQIIQRIYRQAVQANFKVHMGAGGQASRAARAGHTAR